MVSKAKTKTPTKTAALKADKAKRISLNPQPIIDKKTDALKAIGV